MAQYALHAPLDERAYDKRFADSYKNPEDGHKWSCLLYTSRCV